MISKKAFTAHFPYYYEVCHWLMEQNSKPNIMAGTIYSHKLIEVMQCYGLLLCDHDENKYKILIGEIFDSEECPSADELYEFLFSPATDKSKLN